jgi:hypothetical protein
MSVAAIHMHASKRSLVRHEYSDCYCQILTLERVLMTSVVSRRPGLIGFGWRRCDVQVSRAVSLFLYDDLQLSKWLAVVIIKLGNWGLVV